MIFWSKIISFYLDSLHSLGGSEEEENFYYPRYTRGTLQDGDMVGTVIDF